VALFLFGAVFLFPFQRLHTYAYVHSRVVYATLGVELYSRVVYAQTVGCCMTVVIHPLGIFTSSKRNPSGGTCLGYLSKAPPQTHVCVGMHDGLLIIMITGRKNIHFGGGRLVSWLSGAKCSNQAMESSRRPNS